MESRALVTASVSSGAFEVMLSEHFEDPQVLEAAVDPFLSVEFQETHPVGPGSTKNRLDIILQGEAGMRFYLQTKIGGTEPSFRPLIMSDPLVCFGDCLPEHSLLLLEAIHGKQQWFLTFEEVRSAWRLIDPLQAHLDKPDTPLPLYPAGSNGPVEAEAWMEREGVRWME